MSLVICHECSKEISDQAAACPHCGAPVRKPSVSLVKELKKPLKPKDVIVSLLSLVFLAWLFWPSSKDTAAPSAVSEPKKVDACRSDDLQCLGDKGVVGAGVYCAPHVEKFAKHSVRWTDGTFEMKFSHFRWKNKQKGEITYVGNKAEFQNGFGAFTPMIYECDMASDNKTILDIRVREGRLP